MAKKHKNRHSFRNQVKQMETNKRSIKIAVSAAQMDAGESTRSLEIAKSIREYTPEDIDLNIVFISNGGRFEQKMLSNHFSVYHAQPTVEGKGFLADLKPGNNNFVGDPDLAYELLKGEIDALQKLKPDIIMYGFWPFASIARRMFEKPIPGICFLPLPLEPDIYTSSLMKDVPDVMKPLTYLPLPLRMFIMRSIPKSLKLKAPIMKQTNILSAAEKCGWKGNLLSNLFDILESDLTIVNDLDDFYEGLTFPENYKVTGPLYAPAENNVEIDPEIQKIFDKSNNNLKIFCTMGSSGSKELLLEAIKGILSKGSSWNAVILAPPEVCPLDEARKYAANHPNIYITDKFVPAPIINSMADVVISHGGQGTVQTAIASGTPIVGVAMQPEQQINLDNVVMKKGAIRIAKHRWTAHNIRTAVEKISKDPAYKKNMLKLQKSLFNTDGKANAGKTIWNFIDSRLR